MWNYCPVYCVVSVIVFVACRLSWLADELCWLRRVWTVTRQPWRRQPWVRAESCWMCCAVVCCTAMYFVSLLLLLICVLYMVYICIYMLYIACIWMCDFMRCMKMALYNVDNYMWFVCIIIYLIVFDWLYNYVFADLLVVFDVYPCLLWIFRMSANIQFMETGNLLSPDKGDMSGFYLDHLVCRQVRGAVDGWSPVRVGSVAPLTCGQALWLTEFEKWQYLSAGSGELRAGSVGLGGLFSRQWH